MQNVLFVFGCQRSGTTATIDGLKTLEGCHVYDEINTETNFGYPEREEGQAIRLKPAEELKELFQQRAESLLICKPIVESQNAAKILSEFDGSRAIWMLRHYQDVVASMLKKWVPEVGFHLLHSIENQESNDWRSENVGNHIRAMVHYFLTEMELQPADAAAVFWWVRNSLYFQQDLHLNTSMRLLRYEKLVTGERSLEDAISDLGIPILKIPSFYHSRSVAKGSEIVIRPEVRACCEELYQRLLRRA
jgi:hypothetical protein